jgi:hypothetical protein
VATAPKGGVFDPANILRGSPVDRTDWKSYILPLLFFKRICDVWDEEHAEALATYGEDFADEHRFQARKAATGSVVRETPANVGTACRTPCAASRRPTRSTSTACSATPSGPTKTACPTRCSRT